MESYSKANPRSPAIPGTSRQPAVVERRGGIHVERRGGVRHCGGGCRWIMSKTQALNDEYVEGEGLSILQVGDKQGSFVDGLEVASDLLLGGFADSW